MTAPLVNSSPIENTASTGGLSTGAKASIGVGAVALVILIIVAAVMVIRLKKSKKGKRGMVNTNASYMDALMGVHEQKYGADSHA